MIKMKNRKSKAKKRKSTYLKENSEYESREKKEELNSSSNDESEKDSHDEDSSVHSISFSESSSSSSFSSDSNIQPIKKIKTSKISQLLSDSSESGDENCEKCAICLHSIKNQEIGNPEVCDHLFCSVCIYEWSKNSNVCPLDRQQFSIILVRKNKDGEVVKKMPVEERQAIAPENIELEALDDTVCEICGAGDREDIMLLCDNCDKGFHTVCLTPPMENIPYENEWYCPDCEFRILNRTSGVAEEGLNNLFENVRSGMRSLRPRVHMVRTQLLERIRMTVNRIVENYVFQDTEDLETSDSEYLSKESDDTFSLLSEPEVNSEEPTTSGLQENRSKENKTELETKKKKLIKSQKQKLRIKKSKTKSRKRNKQTSTKQKGTGSVKRKGKKRKTRVKTTRTKKIKVESKEGTITEKSIKTRTYKRRRQKKKKKKIRTIRGFAKRRLRVKSIITPKTVKGRLALTLGMLPVKKPGQLLPNVKIRSNSSMSAIDINRARAGIPKLHIFGPRDELQYYSSESDHDDVIVNDSGGIATVSQQRTNLSRLRDRKKAVLALESMPISSEPRIKPVIEHPAREYVDILGSILDSQAIWHSKNTNTNVKINSDGSIEVIKNKESPTLKFENNNKSVNDQEESNKKVITQAPMYPGPGSRAGGFRPYGRSRYGESGSGQDNTFSQRSNQNQTGVSFNRFGAPARNDREGYTNYLSNIPQGPTPFCRGGPPLRFRMPARQQLRRIPFPPRNRPIWQNDEEENENSDIKNKKKEENENKEQRESQSKLQEDEDIDLYSDIEISEEKTDNSGTEEGGSGYPTLGPPPEPSAFLLGIDENGDFEKIENKNKSEVYDPAEPCDSEDEMVIDENQERPSSPEKNDANITSSNLINESTKNRQKISPQKASSDDDEDCPIFSIYSSATREFSQKEEEERQKEIAEDKKKIEEMKFQNEKKSQILLNSVSETHEKQKEIVDETVCKINDTLNAIEKENNISFEKKIKNKEEFKEKVENVFINYDSNDEKTLPLKECSQSPSIISEREISRSSSPSTTNDTEKEVHRSSSESDKIKRSKNFHLRNQSSSPERLSIANKKSKRKMKKYNSDSDREKEKSTINLESDEEKIKEFTKAENIKINIEKLKKNGNLETETVLHKIATGLEGLDVEEVSSENGGDEFVEKRSLSSLSLSELSNRSRKSKSPAPLKKKKKNKKRKVGKFKFGKNYEEGEIDDSDKDNRLDQSFETSKTELDEIGNENSPNLSEKRKNRKSKSTDSEKEVIINKENKKSTKEKSKDKDLSWKKPSKKEKNYREGKKRSKDRNRSKSNEKKKIKSPSPKKDKKKNKERKKKVEKKKDIERYDVRKIVKNKEIRKTDVFGRDIISKSRSVSRSRSRSVIRERSRNMLRRNSRSFSRSRSRSFRRGRSPVRRRYIRSRTRTRSKTSRRTYSRSRSQSRSRKSKKKIKSKERLKIRSGSRGKKSRSLSHSRRRSLSRTRSRSPPPRIIRSKKATRSKRSWSNHLSRSPSFSPRRSRSVGRSPMRMRKSYSRSISTSWSRGRSPLPRTSSLEKLTVVLTTKDKKKWKKKKEGKKNKKDEKKRKKTGNSKEVFASGDNVLVSVNFRNNNNAAGINNNNLMTTDSRNTRLNSPSPVPGGEAPRKKKRGSDYETERITKKVKKSNPILKKVVDVALSSTCPKRAKKLTRLSEKDAEVILSRKPVAVIDLDMSPYREQTPSPVNVVVVSDSGSGDEGKEHTPQRQNGRTPAAEVESIQEVPGNQSINISAPTSPMENGYISTTGPKTPPEPQIKFSINKPQQLRQIANPLGDDDDDDDEEVYEDEGEQQVESLDRRIEKELDTRNEIQHKRPNTPPIPRGPSTPKTPPSPQTSPDAYDPFEPTKSRSPSPGQADKENRLSPQVDEKNDQIFGIKQVEGIHAVISNSENIDTAKEMVLENHDDKKDSVDKDETIPVVDNSSNVIVPSQVANSQVSDIIVNESPERKITVLITTPQNKSQTQIIQKSYTPVLKQLPLVTSSSASTPTSVSLTMPVDMFSITSPTKTCRSNVPTTQSLQVTGIHRLQHRLGSPVNRIPNNASKLTPEKRPNPRVEANDLFSSGNYLVRNATKKNGDQTKQARPLQDATNETIDITMDMDDSPYSPASSEGDDLFDPPNEASKPIQTNSKAAASYKTVSKGPRKSPVKQLSKFDLLFGSEPTLSPLKSGNKKLNAKGTAKAAPLAKQVSVKPPKKGTAKRNLVHKMDEDQLRILDELPSSAVELQVKDKFLKKLNRQERVVDEVKTVLKPHYARKHITKEEYKDILRRSVPKICHSRSGEINPSKIQSLIEAYVRKFRHAKKKGINAMTKPKAKKTMFS